MRDVLDEFRAAAAVTSRPTKPGAGAAVAGPGEQIPPNRLAALAKNGLGSKAPNLARTPEPSTAGVTAMVRSLEAAAIDDALDLFAILMQAKLTVR